MLPLHYSKFSVFNYDQIPAGFYFDAMTSGSAIQRFWHQKKFEEVASRIPDGSGVLDFGCGPGSFLSVLGKSHPRCEAVGVDITSIQIEFARKRVISPRLKFVNLDESQDRLPFPDASFDRVTCVEVIEHIHPFFAMGVLQEMRRMLRPGGKILITTPNYRSLWPLLEWSLDKFGPVSYHDQHINKFTPNALIKFLETAGFGVDSLKSIFVTAPFFSPLSWAFASKVHELEKSMPHMLGSLLVAEAKPLQLS